MNRSQLKKILYQCSQPLSVKQLIQLTGQQFIFPFYHAVADNPPAYLKHIFQVNSTKRFKNDIEFLLKNYQSATLDKVLEYAKTNKKLIKPHFYLTFDDGFAECYTAIAPMLENYGLEATFFINPEFIDNQYFSHRLKISWLIEQINKNTDKEKVAKVFFSVATKQAVIKRLKQLTIKDENIIATLARKIDVDISSDLQKQQSYMTSEQVKDLKRRGFSIGSHSLSHPEFHLIGEQESRQQIQSSFERLEKIIDQKPRLFSFPFSDDGVSTAVFDYLHQKQDVALSFGTAGLKADAYPHHLHRIAMEDENFSSGKQIIKSEYFYYLAKAPLGKNVKRR